MNLLLHIAKASADTRRFTGACSDDRIDLKKTRIDRACYDAFIENARKPGAAITMNIAHFTQGVVGTIDRLWVDGNYLKNSGTFDDSDLATAAIKSLISDKEFGRIKQSVGFYPKKVDDDSGVLVYLDGWLEHSALTTVPVNPRTSITMLVAGAITRMEDAARIVGWDLAEDLAKADKDAFVWLQGKSIHIPDISLGAKVEQVISALSSRIGGVMPIAVFSDQLPATSIPLLGVDQELREWFASCSGEVGLDEGMILRVARSIVQMSLPDRKVTDDDLIELMANKPSYAYLEKLVQALREEVDGSTWETAHRTARGSAGGRAFPSHIVDPGQDQYQASPDSSIESLVGNGRPSRAVRAMLAILESIQRSDLPGEEKSKRLDKLVSELRSRLAAQIEAKSEVAMMDLLDIDEESIRKIDDRELVSLHQRLHQQFGGQK